MLGGGAAGARGGAAAGLGGRQAGREANEGGARRASASKEGLLMSVSWH